MLRIIQSRSSVGAKSYYSHAEYYGEGQELAGRWGGLGAARLGLAGAIEEKDFHALCDNLHPQTHERLTPRTKTDRTVGYDMNFHVPKGVSVLYLLNQDERILDAFRESVDETMREIEADAKTRVRIRTRDGERGTGNLTWGQFIHFTARPVDGVPDPHLHAHVFVLNQTYDSVEERWKAAQFRDIKRDAPYFEAAFHARFAKRLVELGYPIERHGRQWEVASLSKDLTRKFSRRAEQVELPALKDGIADAKRKDQIAARIREKKVNELGMSELRAMWRERLSSDESSALASLPTTPPVSNPHARRHAAEHALSHCLERESVAPWRSVLAEALRHGVGEVDVAAIASELVDQGAIVREWQGREMATTPAVLAEERAMLEFARRGRGASSPMNPQWTIQSDWLNRDQQAAVRHVVESKDRVLLIKGNAGTGKTSLMQEAAKAIEAGGRRVFAFAPSAEASRNVLRNEGFPEATTVADLLKNEKLQAAAQGQVIWIDEAGLLGTRQLKQVFDVARQIDARVILSGDWRQHGSVERGAAMRLLVHEGGLKPAVVSVIQRQSGLYREAVSFLAKGEAAAGYDLLDELGWIVEHDDATRPQAIAREFVASWKLGDNPALVVSPTHAEGDQITQAIRTELKAAKRLGDKERAFLRLMPRNWTTAERADPAMYSPGDVVVFQQNAPGHRRGARIIVGEQVEAELVKHAERFQVYRATEFPLAKGDLVRFTANGQTKDGKHKLNNGAAYEVKDFTPAGDLQLDNGWVVSADYGLLAPGYVVTSHAAQGKTYDRVLIAESSTSFGAANQQQFYVSVSRGKRQALIFTDDKASLKEAVMRATPRLAATELIRATRPNRGRVLKMIPRAPSPPDRQQQTDERNPERLVHEL